LEGQSRWCFGHPDWRGGSRGVSKGLTTRANPAPKKTWRALKRTSGTHGCFWGSRRGSLTCIIRMFVGLVATINSPGIVYCRDIESNESEIESSVWDKSMQSFTYPGARLI
jgi:hypothetical protein